MRKKVLSIVLAMIMVIAMLPTVAFAADYTDTTGNWAESSIDRWTSEGIVEGNPDGTFAPNNNLKRSEFAQTMTKLMKITDTADLSVYTDVDMDSWYVAALEGVVAKGIMKGTSATTLGPDKNLTREQMFVMIGRALGVEPAATCEKDIPDAETASDWSIGYINALVNMGVINGVDMAGDVAPLADIQRGQTMAVLDRLIGGYANEDGQTVEIVPNKITLIVADDVKVTGEAGELPIVVAGAAEKVDMEGVEGEATVQVQVSDVAIENAPVGTEIVAAEDTTGVTANGIDVSGDADNDVVIPEPTPTTPSTGGTPSYTPSTPEPETYTVTFYATWGSLTVENNQVFDETCYGGESDHGVFHTVKASVKSGETLGNQIPKATPREGWKFLGWHDAFGNVAKDNIKYKATGDGEGNTTGELADTTLSELKITDNVNLYAVWLDPNNSTCYGGENDVYGSGTSTAPDTITVTCYSTQGTFGHADGFKDENNPDTCPGGSNGQGQVVRITVTLKTGTALKDAKLLTPSWDSWTFKGWSTKLNSPDTLKDTDTLDHDMPLYAVWESGGQTCYGSESTIEGIQGTGTVPGSR